MISAFSSAAIPAIFSLASRRTAVSFWDVLRPPTPTKAKGSPKPPTADELAAALAEAEAEAERAEAAAGEVAGRRAEQLLTADEPTLDRFDRELQLAQRVADKAAAAVDALSTRLAESREAERLAGRDRVYAKGMAELKAGLAIYAEYDRVARAAAELVEKAADAADRIEAINRELAALGDPRTVPDLDREARRSEPGAIREALWVQAEIPSGSEIGRYYWRLAVARNLEPAPAPNFHQEPHQPGPFRSIRPEGGA
jgi:hypothetical protein